MIPAEVATLGRRLAAGPRSWAAEDLRPLLDDLGLRLEPASDTRCDLRGADGSKRGQVLVAAGSGGVEEVAINVTELADPDDEAELARLADEVERLVEALEPVLGPATRNGEGHAVWFQDGARLELRLLFVVARLVLARDPEARRPVPTSGGGEVELAWVGVRTGLARLLAGLGAGEVIELAAGDRLFVQVGRVGGQVLLLVSGPPTPDLEIGEVGEAPAARLRALGFAPPDGDHLSWWHALDPASESLQLELAAGLVVDALRQAAAVASPDELVWSDIAAGAETRALAGRLGIPRNPHQEDVPSPTVGSPAVDGVRPFDAGERADLLQRILELTRRAATAEHALEPGWRDLKSQLAALLHEYSRRVPRPVVSFDPIGGQPFRLGIDTFGLDGFWWEIDGPRRPSDEPLPPTWYAFNGAMRLAQPYEENGFAVKVGPVAPFVVPRILRRPGVVAVVSEVTVGRHTGWLTVYFAPWPGPPPGKRVNEWARNSYRVRTDDGPFGWDSALDYPIEWDFDLVPWIEMGKVLWTRPGDPAAGALSGDGCPYLGLHRPGDPDGMGILSFGNLRYTQITAADYQGSNPNGD